MMEVLILGGNISKNFRKNLYTKEEAKFFLNNYKNLKEECDIFLIYAFQQGDKSEISSQKTGRENERSLIKKLDNKKYQENKRILKCIDSFMKSLDPESYRLIYARYFNHMKNYDIACKYHMHISTVKRKINNLLDNFLTILNEY